LLLFLIIGGAPLLYLAIGDLNSNYIDANIGLGLAFMFTWIYSVIALIIAIIIVVRKKRKNNSSKD
jgi:membrane protein DedA with SNARE-associated domain